MAVEGIQANAERLIKDGMALTALPTGPAAWHDQGMNSNKTVPDHHDAEIVLKLYELRTEAVMRQSRDAMAKFLPRSYADVAAVAAPEHPHNAAWRQITSYFEMAWGFARHGVANPDFLAENTGEGFLLFAKVHPYLAQYRRELAPLGFKNAEWMLEHSASARQRFELFQARVAKMLAAPAKK
jgi:hypothetical protein